MEVSIVNKEKVNKNKLIKKNNNNEMKIFECL